MKILLASSSPRRLELLKALGHDVTAIAAKVSELDEESGLDPAALAQKNAELKAHYIFETYGLFGADLILGADTIVCLADKIYGKPKNPPAAKEMLRSLSGQTHQVISAYCLLAAQGKKQSSLVKSQVTMRTLSDHELDAYIAIGECMDKAGSYGVQGAGAAIIKDISGSITNVVGLPIEEVLADAKSLIGA